MVSLFLCLAGASWANAHPSLYHNVEIDLKDPATVRIYFTVHAPELPSAAATGVDPVAVDPDWLRGRSHQELATLIREGELLILTIFNFGIAAPETSTTSLPITLTAEPPEQIRDAAFDNGLPDGCFLMTAEFLNPGAPRELAVNYAGSSDKRLMLIVSRPASFPEVKDLAPGDSTSIPLPERPVRPWWGAWGGVVLVIAIALALVAGLAGRVMQVKRNAALAAPAPLGSAPPPDD